MKIWVHGYELKSLLPIPARRGALLKVEWMPQQIGYSDLHPWPEFGEATLDQHLQDLAMLKFSRLTEISLEANYIDREYRQLRRNAFLGLIIPRSHCLIQDLGALRKDHFEHYRSAGYSHLKVKLGRDLPVETESLVKWVPQSGFSWRLDFNGRLAREEFVNWWTALPKEVKAKVDFVEDPIANDALPIDGPWASDWYRFKPSRIRVVKPARENFEAQSNVARVVFTHSMDHPLGQAYAAWSAAQYYAKHPTATEVCGLNADQLYEPTEFSTQWSTTGARMRPTNGTGFGFDEVLGSVHWDRLY